MPDDDNQLPKPVTMTGTAFDNVEDEVKSLEPEKEEETSVSDPSDLPMPAAFGDDDDSDDSLETAEPKIQTDTQQEKNEKEELETKILEDINTNFDAQKDSVPTPPVVGEDSPKSEIKVEKTEAISSKDVSKPIAPVIPENPEEPTLASKPKVEVKEKIVESKPTEPIAPEVEPSVPESKLELEEDKTKLPDSSVAKINKSVTPDETESVVSDDSSHPELNLDQDTEEIAQVKAEESVDLDNDELLVNPFTQAQEDENKNPAETIANAKEAVAQIANLQDTPSKPSKKGMPKAATIVISLLMGVGLVVGGYFAAQSFFGSRASVPVQAPQEGERVAATPTPTPVVEEEPPVETTPSPTPKAVKEETKEASQTATTKEEKYSYVVIDDTPTGWLNARESATTKEDNLIRKVEPGEMFVYLGANDTGWFNIELEDGESAWISGKYATKLTKAEYEEMTADEEVVEEEIVEEELEE